MAKRPAMSRVKTQRQRVFHRLMTDDSEWLREVRRGGAGAAAICFLIGGHSVTSALLEHHLLDALQRAFSAAACGLIFFAAAGLAGHLKGRELGPRSREEEHTESSGENSGIYL